MKNARALIPSSMAKGVTACSLTLRSISGSAVDTCSGMHAIARQQIEGYGFLSCMMKEVIIFTINLAGERYSEDVLQPSLLVQCEGRASLIAVRKGSIVLSP